MAEPYDLRPNIKGKPGSQGTLFQVKDKGLLNPAQRWPRGYTPERQDEVRGAFTDAYGRQTAMHGRGDASDQSQRARVVDTVARSTIPAGHVFGVEKIDSYPQKGTVGTYWPRKAHVAVDMHARNENDESGKTLIHELGHHHAASDREHNLSVGQFADRVAEKDEHTAPFRTSSGELNTTGRIMARQAVDYGVHEGAADNYMVEHYRTRGRNPQPVDKGAYEVHQSEETLEKHYPGYRDIRPKPNLGPQFSQGTLF